MPTRILDVVTNVGHYDDPEHPTGLWLSELSHAWKIFEDSGFEQTLVSPDGGTVPLEPRSLKFPNYDKTAKAWRATRPGCRCWKTPGLQPTSTPPTTTPSSSPAATR